MKKNGSVFTAAAIVAGNGIGSGVMAIPYFVSRVGAVSGIMAFLAAYVVSVLLHLMIAQIMINTGDTADILSSFNTYLFKGRFKNVYKIAFFIIMAVVLVTNLAAYIAGATDILAVFFPNVPHIILGIVFYALAAVLVLLGLRAISIGEKYTVSAMGVILLVALIISIRNVNPDFSFSAFGGKEISAAGGFAATFSMIMFSFSAIFAVPQAIEILDSDVKKIRKSIFLGFLINMAISVVVTICAIITSAEVTKVAIVGWAAAVGGVIQVLGSVFILLAMFTSYWSIGLATTNMISSETKRTFGISFALATIPALLLTFLLSGGFLEYMKIAGGAVAVIISLMLIPTYLICTKGREKTVIKPLESSILAVVFVFVMYIVMAVGSLISV